MEIETQRTDLWTQEGKERAGRTERIALKPMYAKLDSKWKFAI